MISIFDKATADVALRLDLEPSLRKLIADHLLLAQQTGLLELTHIAVIERDDTEEAIIAELGFTPLCNPLSGKRFGELGFQPHWDWCEDHPGWFELIYTVGDSGFAFILFVGPTRSSVSELCRRHAKRDCR